MPEPVESPGNMVQIPITVSFWDQSPTEGTAVILERNFSQRMSRALIQLLIYWGLALVSIFIPVAHFILVPGFLIGGIFAAYRRVKEERTLLTVSAPCPQCRTDQKITPGGRFEPGRTVDCPGCKSELTLESASMDPRQS
jgi:hypothetical protein